jgi:hypothetical protein
VRASLSNDQAPPSINSGASITGEESDARKKLPRHDGDIQPTIPRRQALPRPIVRKLRVFAVDPGLTARFETAISNEMTLLIPWEELRPGPIGEYVAVIDTDEHGKQLHDPVDLDRPAKCRCAPPRSGDWGKADLIGQPFAISHEFKATV